MSGSPDSLEELREALDSGDDYSRVLDQHVSYAPTILGINAFYFIALGLYLLVAVVGIFIADVLFGGWIFATLLFVGGGLAGLIAKTAAPSRYGMLQYLKGKLRKRIGAQTYQTTTSINGNE